MKTGDTLGSISETTGRERGAAPGAQPRARPAGPRLRAEAQAPLGDAGSGRSCGCCRRPWRRSPCWRRPAAASAQQRPAWTARRPRSWSTPATARCCWPRTRRARRSIASTTKLMTALLTLERSRPDEVFTGADYQAGAAESKINLRRRRADAGGRPARGAAAGERQRRGGHARRRRVGLARAFVRGHERARRASSACGARSYANPIGLDDPANYSTAARPGRARPAAAAQPPLRPDRRPCPARSWSPAPPARGEQPQRPRPRALRRRHGRQDRPHPLGGLRARGLGPGAARREGGQRGAGRARARPRATPSRWPRCAGAWTSTGGCGCSTPTSRWPGRRSSCAATSVAGWCPAPTCLTLRRGQRVRTRVDAPGRGRGPARGRQRVGTIDGAAGRPRDRARAAGHRGRGAGRPSARGLRRMFRILIGAGLL